MTIENNVIDANFKIVETGFATFQLANARAKELGPEYLAKCNVIGGPKGKPVFNRVDGWQ